MKKELIVELHASFEHSMQSETETGTEFWLARDLQSLLGYAHWRNFEPVIEKARKACENSGCDSADHFARTRKKVDLGSGAQRDVDDVMLSRYACYLIAQNGDPAKEPVAFAQTYVAVQTRKMEVIEQRLAEMERLGARRKLTESEKRLSGMVFERVGDNQGFARIGSKGDQALFGGLTTQDMKDRLGVSKNRALADFLPTITIKAKDFANEITTFTVQKDNLHSEAAISREHVKNNRDVRTVLTDRGIVPERLPPAEDIQKIQRRLKSENRRLSKDADPLDLPPCTENEDSP
jgi:DNA-damage-inducible protein D